MTYLQHKLNKYFTLFLHNNLLDKENKTKILNYVLYNLDCEIYYLGGNCINYYISNLLSKTKIFGYFYEKEINEYFNYHIKINKKIKLQINLDEKDALKFLKYKNFLSFNYDDKILDIDKIINIIKEYHDCEYDDIKILGIQNHEKYFYGNSLNKKKKFVKKNIIYYYDDFIIKYLMPFKIKYYFKSTIMLIYPKATLIEIIIKKENIELNNIDIINENNIFYNEKILIPNINYFIQNIKGKKKINLCKLYMLQKINNNEINKSLINNYSEFYKGFIFELINKKKKIIFNKKLKN